MPEVAKRETLSNSRVKLTIEISSEEVTRAVKQSFLELSEQVALKGFRKGKAPAATVREAIGETRLREASLREILRTSYPVALGAAKIVPLGEPSITVDTPLTDGTAFKYSIEVEVYPKVEIKDYRAIRVKKEAVADVTDEEVDRVVEEVRLRLADRRAKEGAAAPGDVLEIDFSGTVDGVKQERLESKNHPVWLSKTELVAGFSEALTGLRVLEKKTFSIPYPADHPAKDLASKTVEFTVEVKKVELIMLPAVDDALAARVGFASLLELKTKFRENLAKEKAEAARLGLESRIIDELLKRTEVVLPNSLVEQQVDQLVEGAKADIEKIGGNFLQYLEHRKLSLDEFRASLTPRAEQEVKIGLALAQVAEEEGIETGKTSEVKGSQTSEVNAGHDHSGLFRSALDRLVAIATKAKEPATIGGKGE